MAYVRIMDLTGHYLDISMANTNQKWNPILTFNWNSDFKEFFDTF